MTVELLQGDCLALMRAMDPASVDAIVCDPPYALTANRKGGSGLASINEASPAGRSGGFMGATWDAALPGVAHWGAALRVAKPGAHLVAFGGPRTFHRLACAIEDAGWGIRDCLMWLYGSGFPKSLNLDGEWKGWGTALKPAWEPIVLARKPLIGTVAANVAAHGTGALNVDGCRIDVDPNADAGQIRTMKRSRRNADDGWGMSTVHGDRPQVVRPEGRWPANVVFDEGAAAMLDGQTGERSSGANPTRRGSPKFRHAYGEFIGQESCEPARGAESGGASRFFYCAKASRAEREAGLEGSEEKPLAWSVGTQNPGSFQSPNTHRAARNHHPTVKPVALMRWLVRLVTPPGGLVLDPFMGSGTTGIACVLEGFRFLGMDSVAEYVEIARQRIARAAEQPSLFEVPA